MYVENEGEEPNRLNVMMHAKILRCIDQEMGALKSKLMNDSELSVKLWKKIAVQVGWCIRPVSESLDDISDPIDTEMHWFMLCMLVLGS